jgi:hypothetical protein
MTGAIYSSKRATPKTKNANVFTMRKDESLPTSNACASFATKTTADLIVKAASTAFFMPAFGGFYYCAA